MSIHVTKDSGITQSKGEQLLGWIRSYALNIDNFPDWIAGALGNLGRDNLGPLHAFCVDWHLSGGDRFCKVDSEIKL